MIRREPIVVTTDAAGAGTALSIGVISGEVVEVRLPAAGAALTTGGSADFTLTRLHDGGTILAVTNQSAPWQFNPRAAAHSNAGGTTAYGTGVGPVYDGGIPCDDHIRLVVAQGALSQAGTVYVYYES